jgi:hypothetical protein
MNCGEEIGERCEKGGGKGRWEGGRHGGRRKRLIVSCHEGGRTEQEHSVAY